MDNAVFHKSKSVIDNITKSGNKIIFSLPYSPKLNPIENFFSQLKNHVRNESPNNFYLLQETIDDVINNKIKKEHIKNYFKYLFVVANDFISKNK